MLRWVRRHVVRRPDGTYPVSVPRVRGRVRGERPGGRGQAGAPSRVRSRAGRASPSWGRQTATQQRHVATEPTRAREPTGPTAHSHAAQVPSRLRRRRAGAPGRARAWPTVYPPAGRGLEPSHPSPPPTAHAVRTVRRSVGAGDRYAAWAGGSLRHRASVPRAHRRSPAVAPPDARPPARRASYCGRGQCSGLRVQGQAQGQ